MIASKFDTHDFPSQVRGFDRFRARVREDLGVFDMHPKVLAFALSHPAGMDTDTKKVLHLELVDRKIEEVTGYRLHQMLPLMERTDTDDLDQFLMLQLKMNFIKGGAISQEYTFRLNIQRIPHHRLNEELAPPTYGNKKERHELCHVTLGIPHSGHSFMPHVEPTRMSYGCPRAYSEENIGHEPSLKHWARFAEFMLMNCEEARDYGWEAFRQNRKRRGGAEKVEPAPRQNVSMLEAALALMEELT